MLKNQQEGLKLMRTDLDKAMMKRWIQLIFLIVVCQLVGGLGAIATTSSVDTWYAELTKPSFNPPAWVFGPVWTLLYLMMAIACWIVLDSSVKPELKKNALFLFAAQLISNGIWSPIFFGIKSPGYALFDIIILWVLIIFAIKSFFKVSKFAAYLMLPYFAWVSFAAILNFFLWRLN